jgi:high-affinity Fe2+/Pb2+ permease
VQFSVGGQIAAGRSERNQVAAVEPTTDSALFVAVFLGCVVEAAEALTIVLAAGTGRDWRSAIAGVVCGVVMLALIVAVLGRRASRARSSGSRSGDD